MSERHVAVLGYHKIGPPAPGGWESWFYIPEDVFAAQLDVLDALGWPLISARELLRGLEDPETLPPRSALLTFDDGHLSMHDVALPILRRRRAPAVVFIPSDHVGADSSFDPAEPCEPLCDWRHLRELQREGVEIGSHAATHTSLSTLDIAGLEDEIVRSARVLRTHLAADVELFSFPFGDTGADPAATDRALAVAGYHAAFTYDTGVLSLPVSDRLRLPRVAVGPDTDIAATLATTAAHAL